MWARAKYYYRTGQQSQIDKFDKEDEKMKKKVLASTAIKLLSYC